MFVRHRIPSFTHACAALLACSWLCAVASPSRLRAQELDLERFDVPASPSPAFTIDSAEIAHSTRFGMGAAFDFAHGLLEGSSGRALVTDIAKLDVLASLALFDVLELGLALPWVTANAVPDLSASARPERHFGLGDVRVAFTVPLLRERLPFAFTLSATLPTASDDTWSGSGGVTLTPAFVMRGDAGRVTLSAKAGFRLVRRTRVLGHEQDDELLLAAGAAYALPSSFSIVSEVRAFLGIGGRSFSAEEAPMEIDLGGRYAPAEGATFTLGAGVGGFPGERGVGAPVVRVFAAVGGSFAGAACKLGAEDIDGFEDADGCADPDNDADALPDTVDACPNDVEDHDGFADDDGCPDADNDADGVLDARDLCPRRSEDRDGYQDTDGCPEPDNDADLIADGADVCRMDPEDRDDFEDDDGCPEPGPGRPTVTLEGTRILLSDHIYFDDDADTIRAVSKPVLDELAEVVRKLVQNKRLRVEGHSDNSGAADYNVDLSYRRARAVVEYLKARGVPGDRLEQVGYGAQKPLAPNDSPEGRALNRRVEFTILDEP